MYKVSNDKLGFENSSLFHNKLLTCFDDKNCPNLSSFNFKKVIYSTGFYSPPVIENEAYT